MNWINPYGLLFISVLLIPNIVFAAKCPQGFENTWENKTVERLEQIGRFGCFGFMVIHIPGTWFGFPSDEAFAIYLMADAALVACYCLIWILCFRKNSLFRALALSILPSLVFLLSGILSRSLLLVLSSLIFAPCHILLSYKNAILAGKRE